MNGSHGLYTQPWQHIRVMGMGLARVSTVLYRPSLRSRVTEPIEVKRLFT